MLGVFSPLTFEIGQETFDTGFARQWLRFAGLGELTCTTTEVMRLTSLIAAYKLAELACHSAGSVGRIYLSLITPPLLFSSTCCPRHFCGMSCVEA